MPPGGFRTHNLSRRATEDLRLRTRGHWDRLYPPVHPLNPVYTLLILVRLSSGSLTCTFRLLEILNPVSIFHHSRIPSEESVVDRGKCSRRGKPTIPCLHPVTDVFQLKIHWAEVQ